MNEWRDWSAVWLSFKSSKPQNVVTRYGVRKTRGHKYKLVQRSVNCSARSQSTILVDECRWSSGRRSYAMTSADTNWSNLSLETGPSTKGGLEDVIHEVTYPKNVQLKQWIWHRTLSLPPLNTPVIPDPTKEVDVRWGANRVINKKKLTTSWAAEFITDWISCMARTDL